MQRNNLIGTACQSDPELPAYEPRAGYSTPVPKVTARHGNFWSGLDPVQEVSRAGDDAPVAFASIAREVRDKALAFAEKEGIDVEPANPRQIVGTMEVMFPRVGVGAFGEARYIALLEAAGETVLPPEDGDEDAGIDVRTDRATYQVKTYSRNPLEDNDREELIGEADHLIWMTPDGEAVEL